MTVSIPTSVLLGWYQSFFGGSGTGLASTNAGTGTAAVAAPPVKYAPTPPWDASVTQPKEPQRVQAALRGQPFVNPSAAQLDLAGASGDYRNLFALYQGLQTLYSVADQASGAHVSSFQLDQLSAAFKTGLAQVQAFAGQTDFSKLRLTTGTTAASETSAASTPEQATSYRTAALNTSGDSSAVVPAFSGAVAFDVQVQHPGLDTTIQINLANMGSTPRTMANVLAYLNGQMAAAGAIATFSANPMPAQPDTINVGGKSVTVSAGQEQWGLALATDPLETVTLSAPQTGPAVYLGQIVGNQTSSIAPGGSTVASDAQSQLVKFQTGGLAITPPQPPAFAAPGQLFTDALGAAVNSVQSTATAPDGSVYVLADVNATPSGAAAPGGQDAALLKYDSAGHLLFQSDLGSASAAGGLSLAVSGDGSHVAVAGSITGPLVAGQALNNPGGPDSFVAVYDSQGNQTWRQEQDGLAPNQASAVAFGADGSLYVAGQTQSVIASQPSPTAPSDAYLQVYSPAGAQESLTRFGASGGVNTVSGVAIDGANVYLAGVQNGHAVVSEYDASSPSAPSLVASRDLGNLQGGGVAGIAVQGGTVYLAGSTHDASLSAGTVTSAMAGPGLSGFAATLSTGLAPASSDAIAYYGGSGDTNVSGLTVSGGQAWITGSSTGSLPGAQPPIGALDGYVAALNVASGSVAWSQRFTGLDGRVDPTSIAVAPTGASILDQLGLPQGVVDGPVSDLVTSATSVKAGDSFTIATGSNAPVTITVGAADTMASLAQEIMRATASTASVTAQSAGGATSLRIQPLTPQTAVTLGSGPPGADALAELGLEPGIVADAVTSAGKTFEADGGHRVYALGITSALDLRSAADISHAKAVLTAAISVIKGAYQDLKTAATPANVLALQKAQATGGAVPAYITDQIANYQAALSRLTAGQTSATSPFAG
ncbi:MAG TPA: hypothetical protein VMU93_01705 [Caulobacteraceae bacterium]|nr:hypothetical protein [Caulobacteraceae bacterium]